MNVGDSLPTLPRLSTSGRLVRNAADTEPTTVDDNGGALLLGQELLIEDTGTLKYWNGTAFAPVTVSQKLCQLADLLTELRDLLLTKE